MRLITKNAEPRSLLQHRTAAHSNYENYSGKDELRAALASEQKGLCCYCTGRIRIDAMKIEHWRCQAIHPDLQLAYANLLGACLGGQGRQRLHQHCDTKKASRDLKWNPADPSHAIESRVRYLSDGRIESTDPEFNEQLDKVLGLNNAFILSNRKKVLDAVLEWWQTTPKARQNIQHQITRRTCPAELEPYDPVAVYFLRQRL